MPQNLLPGTVITLGGVAYTMPPCGFDTLEKYATELDEHIFKSQEDEVLNVKKITLIVNLVWSALQLNYPDIERALVARGLNTTNAADTMRAVMAMSLPAAPTALKSTQGEGVKSLGE